MTDNKPSRRTFLKTTIGVVGGLGFAGCSSDVSTAPSGESVSETTTRTTTTTTTTTTAERQLFDRVQFDKEGIIRVGLNHPALGEDKEEVTQIVLLDSNQKQVASEYYGGNSGSVEFEAVSTLPDQYTYGTLTVQAQNDFGDVFAERTLTYEPDLSISVLNVEPKYQYREDPPQYVAADDNSYGVWTITMKLTNNGDAPVYYDHLEHYDLDGIVGPPGSWYPDMYWQTHGSGFVPAGGSNTVSMQYSISEVHKSGESLERTYPCGSSYTWEPAFVFKGGWRFQPTFTMSLSGTKQKQPAAYQDFTLTYCTEFDVEHVEN